MTDYFNTRVTLISRLRDNYDSDAWEDFVTQYKPYIYAVVLQTTKEKNDRDDIVQNVLLILWKSLPKFEYQPGQCKFRTWMKVIIRNEMTRHSKKNTRHTNDIERHSQQRLVDDIDDIQTAEIDRIADREWELYISNLAWDKVSNEYSGKVAECFEMFLKGESIENICTKLDIKQNTAYIFRQRVKKSLRREILLLEERLG